MRLLIDAGLLDELIRHMRQCLPEEGCGFLVGFRDRASRFVPAPNELRSGRAFSVDRAVLFDLFRNLRASGEELVAICHSHPSGPAHPSARDVEEAHYPSSFYLIVSFAGSEPEARAWTIRDGEVLEVEIHASC